MPSTSRAPHGTYFAPLSPVARRALPATLTATIAAFRTTAVARHCATAAGAFSNCGAMATRFTEFARTRGHAVDIVLLRSAPFDDHARLWTTADPRLEAVHPYGWHHYATRIDGAWLVDWSARQFDPEAPHPVVQPATLAPGHGWRALRVVVPAAAPIPETAVRRLVDAAVRPAPPAVRAHRRTTRA